MADQPIYLDYHATTPVDRRVADRIYRSMTEEFGNASNTNHECGDRAEAAVKQAAKQVADLVDQFNKSCGSENNEYNIDDRTLALQNRSATIDRNSCAALR